MTRMRILLTSLLASCILLTAGQAAPASINLLDGSGLAHFQPVSNWHRVERAVEVPDRMELTSKGNGGGVVINGRQKDISIPYLVTRETFGDVRVELEFMIPKGSNAGLYLMGRYEVQIFDSFGKAKVGSADMGGIYGSKNPSKPDGEQWVPGAAPLLNAAKSPGSWQRMEIVFRAPRFNAQGQKTSDAVFESVHINGQLVQDNTVCTYPTMSHPIPGEAALGPIALQGDHGPIAIRHFTATPLESPGTQAILAIDAYWQEVERSVREGDFEAYSATIHPDAVIIAGAREVSYPLAQALIRWEKDFVNTKSGQLKGEVDFRFAQRYRDTDTAHETGIFRYTSTPKNGVATTDYIAFEALLVKKDGRWLMLMENQLRTATQEEWDALALK